MNRVFIDMDNVLVDFQSGLDQVSVNMPDGWMRFQACSPR